jgi:dipeptidyl aminopeptidase/acylaminoacyl peptidase
MRRSFALPRAALAAALVVAPVMHALAQEAAAPGKRPLTLADYGKWARITSSSISSDGKWAAYVTTPNDGDATLTVKQLDGDKSFTSSLGTAPAPAAGGGGGGGGAGGAAAPQFSDDARFIAYFVNPPDRGAAPGGAGRGAGRGAAPPGTQPARGGVAPAATATTPVRRFELMNLATGEKTPIPNAATFKFAKGARWLAVRLNKADAAAKHNGADLVLRELATGSARNIGNVNQYDFDDAGKLLAYTVDAADKLGNGVYLFDPASGSSRALSSASADYDQLAWSDEGANLAALRGDKKTENKQKDNTLLAWIGAGATSPRAIEFDPTTDASFPKGYVVSEFTAPRWSKDGSRVFFGIKEQDKEILAADSLKANVDVWHYKDADIQSVQIVRLAQERRATHPAALVVGTKHFVRLGDDDMRNTQNVLNGKWTVGRFETPYRGEVQWSGAKGDYYRVNTETGERSLIAKALTRTYGSSPDSRWFLYVKDTHLQAYNLETGKSVDVDALCGGKSFIDTDDDHPYEKPIWGVGGWTTDGSVLLYDKYDIWKVSPENGKVLNLTNGVGKAQMIQFRVVRYGAGGRGGRGGRGGGAPAEDEEGIDLAKPLTLSAYGDLTKKSGYWTVTAGKAPTPLLWADKSIGGAQKAEHADRVIFTQQSFTEFPDIWTSGTDFANARKITDVNPQISEFAWGKRVLVDYVNGKGKKMQATVTLPAGYEPGKKYPTIVYFYEILSNTHNQFSMPVYDDRPHFSTYASNGYVIVQPDIVYETGKPGSSALDCVTSAVKRVIELGFILTQTDMFKTVVTGAPPADLVSMYDQLYKQTGTVNHGIFEIGQVRMGEGNTPWTAKELYESQSPVHNVRNIKTPFLILQGTDDGAVDWVQGLEWYNAARRWGKEVVFLSYPGEPHHLAKKENQKDFQIRMRQWFDHYLKDAPAPKWMTEGVPQTKKYGPLQ